LRSLPNDDQPRGRRLRRSEERREASLENLFAVLLQSVVAYDRWEAKALGDSLALLVDPVYSRPFNERLLLEPEKHHLQLCNDAEVTTPLTCYLSRLLGVFLLVTAVSEWAQSGLLTVVAPAMVDQPALLWVSGILTFASAGDRAGPQCLG
jgi:hypothetical protein